MSEKLVASGVIVTGAFVIHPYAAAGAAFGCCFFLARPTLVRGWRRLLNGLFSWGMGYAVGAFVYPDPQNFGAMAVGGAVSALVAVVFTALAHVAETNGTLPPWLNAILDRVPFLKRGSGGNE